MEVSLRVFCDFMYCFASDGMYLCGRWVDVSAIITSMNPMVFLVSLGSFEEEIIDV